MEEVSENPYCRLCLTTQETSKDTSFTEVHRNTRLHERITNIFGFDPVPMRQRQKRFSTFICYECRMRVDDIGEFVENVQKNQEKLEKAFVTEIVTVNTRENEEVYSLKQEEEMEVEYLNEDLDELSLKGEMEAPVYEEVELDEKPFVCHYCSRTWNTKASLTQHMTEEHLSFVNYECGLCGEMFISKSDVRRHRKEIHPKEVGGRQNALISIEKYLLCEMCDPTPSFASFKDMTDHYQDIHGTRGYARCCDKQFFTRKSIVNHSDVHSNPADYMCKICKKILPDKYTLRDHILRHNPDEERKFECDFCQKKFHVHKDLSDHINRLHRKKKNVDEKVDCLKCCKTFVSKYSLMTHNRRFHMDLERPICKNFYYFL